jgi:hypothetical protein
MKLTLNWQMPPGNYQDLLAKINSPNLLQDPVYGRAHAWFYNMSSNHGLVCIDGNPAGIFQWFEKRALGGLIHALMLDRGPLWLPGFGEPSHQEAFFRYFNKQFPRRPGRRRRVIPEVAIDQGIDFASCGLRPTTQSGYATHLVDLAAKPEQLRARLSGKWRSALHKAEQLLAHGDLRTDWTGKAERIRELLRWHQQDQQDKDYRSAHPVLLKKLLMEYAKVQALLLGVAYHKGEACSAVAILCHGCGATYQLAWNSPAARQTGTNNLLLWQAMLALQQRGVSCLDLGGFNEQAPGLQRFKAGLGGRELRLAGMFA